MVLVSMGLFSLFTEHVGEKVQELESLLVVRSLRLLRLIRALRLLKQFRTVWRLVNGLLTSANAMVSTLVLVVLSLYIAACLGIEIITKDSDLTSRADPCLRKAQEGQAPGDSIDCEPALWKPVQYAADADGIRHRALANASADKEMERMDLREKLRSEMPRLSQIFDEIDKDCSGTLTMDEMAMVPVDIIPEELRSKSRVSSMQDLGVGARSPVWMHGTSEVFEMLDVDGGGELTREESSFGSCNPRLDSVKTGLFYIQYREFVDGLLNLFMHDDPATSVQTLRLLRKVDMKVMHLTHEIREVDWQTESAQHQNETTGQSRTFSASPAWSSTGESTQIRCGFPSWAKLLEPRATKFVIQKVDLYEFGTSGVESNLEIP
eukprot:s1452_g5.t1